MPYEYLLVFNEEEGIKSPRRQPFKTCDDTSEQGLLIIFYNRNTKSVELDSQMFPRYSSELPVAKGEEKKFALKQSLPRTTGYVDTLRLVAKASKKGNRERKKDFLGLER